MENGVLEMTVENSPAWAKNAAKDIAAEFNINSVLDKMVICGIIMKHFRTQK